LLHAQLTIYPPANADAGSAPPLLVELTQGSHFAILPTANGETQKPTVEWNAGNIYAMERALPKVVPLPTQPSPIEPTTYNIYISGDYEVNYEHSINYSKEVYMLSDTLVR
jgi:hypothetical protein